MKETQIAPASAGGTPAPATGAVPGKSTLTGALVQRATASSSAPLPDATRGRFESSLGGDLSAVRVHTGAASADAAGALGARAYTTGNDIHFAASAYDPDEPEGLHLLAHEVAHTQQQAGAAPIAQAKLEVSSPGDASEQDADTAADAMVAGTPTAVTTLGGTAPIQRDAVDASKKAPAADPVADFKVALAAKQPNPAKAMVAWKAIDDKAAVDEATVVDAIGKIPPPDAMTIVQGAKKGFTGPIVDAIVAVHAKYNWWPWHDALKGMSEEIASCPATDQRHKLAPLVQGAAGGYTPKLSPQPAHGVTLAAGQDGVLELSDGAALDILQHVSSKWTPPKLLWKLTAPEDVFGPQPIAPEPATAHAVSIRYPMHPKKTGAVDVTAEVTAVNDSGIVGTSTQRYTLEVIDASPGTGDPKGFFEARFKEEFHEILDAGFATEQATKDAIADLFTEEQRAAIAGFIDSRIVPPRLFDSGVPNIAKGPQRVLISSHMLTNGKIVIGGTGVDGTKWAASCCGGWVNGVYCYAGVNFAGGFGANDVDQVISPTGEKSFGTGSIGDATSNGSQGTPPALAKLQGEEAKLQKPISDLEKRIKQAQMDEASAMMGKKKDPAKAKKAHDDGVAAAAELKVLQGKLPAELEPIHQQEKLVKLESGSSPYGYGHTNLQPPALLQQVKPGDWLYLDNDGAAGHSVIFVEWVSTKVTPCNEDAPSDEEAATGGEQNAWDPNYEGSVMLEKSLGPRSIQYLEARVYSQPGDTGGKYETYKLGFPQSTVNQVNGVYSIVHARPDANPAADAGEFLVYYKGSQASAIAANKKLIAGAGIDAAALKTRLQKVVQAMVDGVVPHVRPDKPGLGGATGDLSDVQKKACATIIAGTGSVDADIANLVALGEKLGALDRFSGDPSIDGLLTTSVAGDKGPGWTAPLPTWATDPSLKAAPT